MPSAVRAFFALVWFSFIRQARVRQVAWVAFALLAVTVLVVGVVTHGPLGWRMENRERTILRFKPKAPPLERPGRQALFGPAAVAGAELGMEWQRVTYQEYSEQRLPLYEMLPGPPEDFAVKSAVFAAFRAVVSDQQVQDDYAFLNYSRWAVYGFFLFFLLPLFTLAYASGAIGAEREGRTLIWLITRPLPRWAIYVAKLLGGLPWCVGVTLAGFLIICLAGGELGRKSLTVYWPVAAAGAVTFGCVFHMVGALFRRPTVVGMVYVFFFEMLVPNLPGGLKLFSLNYYLRSLFYNALSLATTHPPATEPTVTPEALELYEPAEPGTCWIVLVVVSVAVTALGAWLFGRQEPKDET